MVKAVVLEEKDKLSLRDIEVDLYTPADGARATSASAAATCTTTPTARSAHSRCARR